MTHKKKLIIRMARVAGVVFLFSLLVSLVTLLSEQGDRDEWRRVENNRRAEIFEQSRVYLDELAKRIDAAPVDPALVSEIESDYFEKYSDGPMSVWAMATDGSFLFGVPRESFSRMNAIYDREITPRLSDGVFFDRQSFFLGHLDDDGGALLLRDLVGEDSLEDDEDYAELWESLSHYAERSDDGFILSAPVMTSSGTALGSVYLKQSPPPRNYFYPDQSTQTVRAAAGTTAVLTFLFLWILLPTWVYVDAREKSVPRAPLFAFLTAVSSVVGLVVYLIARPEHARSLVCPGCDNEVSDGAYCPHCGNDLSSAFCQTCSYPLAPDWSFCPSCRTEIGPPPPHSESPVPTQEGPGSEAPLPEPG